MSALNGTAGNDTLDILPDTTSVDAGDGDDTVNFWIDFAAGETTLLTDVQGNGIEGGAGIDTIDISGMTLAAGHVPVVTNSDGTFDLSINIAFSDFQYQDGVVIDVRGFENVVGSDFRDSISGNSRDNVLEGGAGDDRLSGANGNDLLIGGTGGDVLIGGNGIDTASYRDAAAGVTASLADATLNTGDAAGDEYRTLENLQGSNFRDFLDGDANANVIDGGAGSDFLFGGAGDDTLLGGAGTDLLEGGEGADVLDGGDGRDYVDYRGSTAAVGVDLLNNVGAGGEAEGDTFVSIEAVIGSDFQDLIQGDAANNILYGGGAEDGILGGDGRDIIFGEEGDDQLFGEGGDDVIYSGNGGAVGGFSIISGGDGNDLLIAGDGAEELSGNAGFDTVSYRLSTSGVEVDLEVGNGFTGYAEGDTYFDIERLYASNFDDRLDGSGLRELLYGFNGDDFLNGLGGDDLLVGGNGNDTILGGEGNDNIIGGAGDDVLQGGPGRDFLAGGAGADEFVVSRGDSGQSVIRDFSGAEGDIIDITDFASEGFTDLQSIQDASRDAGNNVLIDLGGTVITIVGLNIEDLMDGFFEFGSAPAA